MKRQIKSIDDLIAARDERLAVYIPSTNPWIHAFGPQPAAFVLNMNAQVVHSYIKRGLFVYTITPKLHQSRGKSKKTLGQIAYDGAGGEGGKENWGPWESAPDLVRRVHERMAKAVERAVVRRIGKESK